ncbi:MAG: indole-3-glycerol-phosphate synthase, partial [bacterium]
FRAALTGNGIKLIAEIKPSSPSRGRLTELEAVKIARVYRQESPSAISVLTDKKYFGQSLSVLKQVRMVVDKPLLRKDFIIDPYQVYESAAAGADAILLIAAILPPKKLMELHDLALQLEMDSLVEIHSESELESLPFQPPLLGINNRRLDGDLSTDLAVTEHLAGLVGSGTVLVSESGIKRFEDIRRLQKPGNVNAVLVGTSLLEDVKNTAQLRHRIRNLMSP